jgi:hypothetical protein
MSEKIIVKPIGPEPIGPRRHGHRHNSKPPRSRLAKPSAPPAAELKKGEKVKP